MRKNISCISLNAGPGLSVRGVNSPQNIKKVEGIDKTTITQSFNQKIQKIKRKPEKQTLEDAYVTGLQDQIHYLELQLKLLKQKQIAKHSQVDQLETFFGDGIPINQNILALKNGFNNYKSQVDKKIQSLQTEKKERQHIIESLSVKTAEMTKNIHDTQKTYKQFLTSGSNITHDKVKKETALKQKIQIQDQHLKTIKTQNRKLAESITNIQRAKQLILVALLKNQNNKYNKLNKLRESIVEKQKQFEQIGKNYEELKKQQDDQTYVIKVQQNNIKLKKKIISLDKQLNNLHTKIQEKKMDLQAKLKERHKQIVGRMDIQKRLEQTKQAIERQNNMSIPQLQKIARAGVAKALQKILDKNKKLTKYLDYYGNLQYKIQQRVYQLGEKKPQLKRQLQIYQNDIINLTKQIQKQKARHCQLTSEIAKIKSKEQFILQIVPPVIQQIKRQQQLIRSFRLQKQRLLQQIKVKQKQLSLMEILKCISLEQTEISNCSNSSIQDQLIDFMRNWEGLNRN